MIYLISKSELKEQVNQQIASAADSIMELGETIFRNPELGYKETFAAGLIADRLKALTLPVQTGLAITGVKASLQGRGPGIGLALLSELDAVVCPGHPAADPRSGAAHACGHHAQVAAMYGAAMGLVSAQAMTHLAGTIHFIAVPAEEYVEIEYRQKLREEGKIRFIGGKQELLACGHLDDVDMAMMVHQAALGEEHQALVGGTSNGFIGKLIRFQGREAHAGGSPHEGINALNAAMLGIMGVHMVRETFQDKDSVRVHPIITKGGDLVNVVPADVRVETYVRGRTMEAITDASLKVNRALRAGADAIGAGVEIRELPGYLPRIAYPELDDVFRANIEQLVGAEWVGTAGHGAGSTDMGDLMHVMPAIHPTVGGCCGRAHSEDFGLSDRHLAYIVPAQALAMTAIDLLWDDAALGRELSGRFEPLYSRSEYMRAWEKIME